MVKPVRAVFDAVFGVGIWVGLVLLLGAAGWRMMNSLGADVWRASYFDNLELRGTPVIKTYPRLDLDWGRGQADRRVRRNGMSARFETCLDLQHDSQIDFVLEAKDGAILKVDGKTLANSWTRKKLARQTARAELGPGKHHVEVALRKDTGAGRVVLLASVNGGSLGPLDRQLGDRQLGELPATGKNLTPERACSAN